MKRCPTCNRTFTDRNLSFCIDDGTPLVPVIAEGERPRGDAGNWNAPPYQPPGTYTPPGSTSPRRTWPWVLGILAVVLLAFVAFGVVAAIYVPRLLQASANKNRPIAVNQANRNDDNSNLNTNPYANENVNKNANANVNANTNLNGNENANAADLSETPPTDAAEVLADLTDLEHQWTVANINADKKALDRILADDYVGITDGKTQGKRQYLRDIQRDTSVEKWDFDDLKLNLKGDRATLTGIVSYVIKGQDVKFHFTDKFVWRDGRWQATASEVNPIKS